MGPVYTGQRERTAITRHALDRVWDRLQAEGLTLGPRALARLEAHAQRETGSAAMLLFTLPEKVGDLSPDVDSRGSNGDTVWAIVVGGRVVTVYFRRSTQPMTCAAFRVDTVYTQPLFDIREVTE